MVTFEKILVGQGVCPKKLKVTFYKDKLMNFEFEGGCQGNLKALSKITSGMNINDFIDMFDDLTCGKRDTSCMNELVKVCKAYKELVRG